MSEIMEINIKRVMGPADEVFPNLYRKMSSLNRFAVRVDAESYRRALELHSSNVSYRPADVILLYIEDMTPATWRAGKEIPIGRVTVEKRRYKDNIYNLWLVLPPVSSSAPALPLVIPTYGGPEHTPTGETFIIEVMRVLGLVSDAVPFIHKGVFIPNHYAVHADRASWLRAREINVNNVCLKSTNGVMFLYVHSQDLTRLRPGSITVEVRRYKHYATLWLADSTPTTPSTELNPLPSTVSTLKRMRLEEVTMELTSLKHKLRRLEEQHEALEL